MKLIFEGKTKDLYELGDGNYMFKLKDDVTVGKDGKFDPGANATGLKIDGLRFASLKMTAYYFDLLNKKGVPTHFISADMDNASMIVRPAKFFGEGPALEVICRFRAIGSFYRRYQNYCEEGAGLNALVEMTLKDDEKGDPFITKETLIELNILAPEEYETLVSLTQKIARIIKEDMAAKNLELYDMKLEFGKIDGEIALVDEISGGSVRVYKNGVWLQPLDLAKYF